MKSHRIMSLPQLSQRTKRSGMPILLASLAAAVLLVAGPLLAQSPTAQSTPAAAQPAAVALAQPAPVQAAPAQAAPEISAPVPMNEQASLSNPFSDSNSPSAGGQASAPAQSFSAPTHTQGPHHTLGKTMAILGTITLGVGVTAYALADEHCKKYTGEICGGFHNGGIGLMAGGGALAGVGFYWEFQKPKQ
jgi:hypothetical protein